MVFFSMQTKDQYENVDMNGIFSLREIKLYQKS